MDIRHCLTSLNLLLWFGCMVGPVQAATFNDVNATAAVGSEVPINLLAMDGPGHEIPLDALPDSSPTAPTTLSCHNAAFGDFTPDRAPFGQTSAGLNKYSVDTIWSAITPDGSVATLSTTEIINNSGEFITTGPNPTVFFEDFTDPNTGFTTPKLTEQEGEPGDAWVMEINYSRPLGNVRVLVGDIDSYYANARTRFMDVIAVESFLQGASTGATETYIGTDLVESVSGNRYMFSDNPAQTNRPNPFGFGPNPSESGTSNRIVVDYQNTFIDTTQITYAVGADLEGGAVQSVFMTSGMAAGCQIGGNAFEDGNLNDALEVAETGLGEVAVTLYKDDGDNVFEPNSDDLLIETKNTVNGGDYLFTSLAENATYWVDIDTLDTDLESRPYGGGDVDTTQTSTRQVEMLTVDVTGVNFPFDPARKAQLALVKRITAINRGLDNPQIFDTSFVDVGTPQDNDNEVNWPGAATAATIGTGMVESYLSGIVNGADSGIRIGPNDQIEYTLPFLSMGSAPAHDVLICDRIPTHTTFVSDAFNNAVPAAAGAGDRGLLISVGGQEVALTNINDGHEIASTGINNDGVGGYYFPAGVDPSIALGVSLNCGGVNENGAIVADLGNIPHATGEGFPNNAYGFIRFRVAVN